MKNVISSTPRATGCYAVARRIAEQTVEQWDCHDVFRVCEADKALWHGDEPNEVVVAREFLRLLCVAEQAVVSRFSSCAANGVLQSAVKSYQA